jgi:hypothetical protein
MGEESTESWYKFYQVESQAILYFKMGKGFLKHHPHTTDSLSATILKSS